MTEVLNKSQEAGQASPVRDKLYAVMLRLHPVEPGWLYPNSGSQAHAVFLDVVRQHNPMLSEELHRADQRRPFTVGPLQGFSHLSPAQLEEAIARGNKVPVKPGQLYWLRFTMLDEAVFGTFARHFLGGFKSASLRIGEASFEMSRMLGTPDPTSPVARWAGFCSFGELFSRSQPATRYQFEFASPTAFSHGQKSWGKHIKLLPEPRLIFESLAQRWDSFAPESLKMQTAGLNLKDFSNWCDENLLVSRVTLDTRSLHFKKFPQVGFQGRVTYEFKGDPADPEASWLSRLAAFTFYAGVGYKTTMGMGQTRWLEAKNRRVGKDE